MLLLGTILLVVVGTISLVIGFVQSSLLPIYISIACSVLAAVVLLIFSRMTAKSQQVVTAGDGPTPLDLGRDRPDQSEREPAFAGTGLLGGSSGESFAPPESRYASGSRFDEPDGDQSDDSVLGVGDAPDTEPDDDFPIERYDSRRVGEILPLLAELDLDELDIVREHEEQGKSRATVLARIDQLIDQLEAEDQHEAAHRFDTPEPAGAGAGMPLVGRDDDLDDGDLDDRDLQDHDDLQDSDGADGVSAPLSSSPPSYAPPPPTQAVTVGALPDDDGYFPIEDYDDLRASEILPLLPELDDDELVMVQEREQSTAARSSILRRIETLLPGSAATVAVAVVQPEPEPEPWPSAEPVPTLVTPDPVLPAKKAGTRRAAPAKTSVAKTTKVFPAKTIQAKRSAVKKAAAVAPVAPARKAPAAKAAATSRTKKAVAPVIAEVPAKKAAAKKAPSAKVASARASAASKGGGTASAAAVKKAAAKATKKTTKG